MTARYVRGNVPEFVVAFTDANGGATDPAIVIAQFWGSDNTVHQTFVERLALGSYRFFIDSYLLPDVVSQVVYWRCYSPDGDRVQAAAEGSFQLVTAGNFPGAAMALDLITPFLATPVTAVPVSGIFWQAVQPVTFGVATSTPQIYRTGVTTADVAGPPGTITSSLIAGGSLATVAMQSKVAGVNVYGRTLPATGTPRTPAGGNLAVRLAFAAVPGMSGYDIALSADADPKCVARITEGQRAAGCVITAQDTVVNGGVPGAVDVQVAGTGEQFLTAQAISTAYVMPSPDIDFSGHQYGLFYARFTRTGGTTPPSCTLLPLFYNSRTALYYEGSPYPVPFGGTSGMVDSLPQAINVEVRGQRTVLIVTQMSAGLSLDLDVSSS